jgi:hypothetical protein
MLGIERVVAAVAEADALGLVVIVLEGEERGVEAGAAEAERGASRHGRYARLRGTACRARLPKGSLS